MTPEDKAIPDEFILDSKVVFISNLPEIPESLDEDIFAIQLNYTKSQASVLLDARLEELLPEYPDLTLNDKKEIFATIKRYKKISEITLKDFIHAAVIWKSSEPNKDVWIQAQLR